MGRDDERERPAADEEAGGEEYEGGVAAPPEGEQERSHESDETLSPDERRGG